MPRVGDVSGSRIERSKSDIATLRGELLEFKLDTGRFPSTNEGLQALVVAPPGVHGWRGPYASSIPLDEWGHEYAYRSPGTIPKAPFALFTLGADAHVGGEGDDSDVGTGL